uniref:Uncharacterized protein n=1 Tax=Asterionellopsis glacialis TaxID=33640 RepID=A0A7S0KZM9_9STRA|mmetsp:Transcript_622/g.924  ORF Transcript_622/g.924 Transcript_622/m.924 type:complete len:136 (+) Transcript_622:169-576(+)
MLDLPIDQQIERIRGDLHVLRSKITYEEDIYQNQVTQLQMKQEHTRQIYSLLLKFSQNNFDMCNRAVKQVHQDEQAPPHIISLEANLCSVIHHLGKIHIQTKLVNEQSYDTAKIHMAGVGHHAEMAAIKEVELLK